MIKFSSKTIEISIFLCIFELRKEKKTAIKPTDAGQPTLGKKKKYKFPEL